MSIKSDYFRYLDHFENTYTIREVASNRDGTSRIALRHDVDHDLDIALEMSYQENQRGFNSTYYLLDTAPYWSDPALLDKTLQMTDYGHEIGLHINSLAKWVSGDIQDIFTDLQSEIGMFRNAGIDIRTVSTHGDPLCYSQQFINYWCFKELRTEDPVSQESGLSAEGIPVSDPRFQIQYPDSHQLQRQDGQTFRLWSVSMHELGLEHDAMHFPFDSYYSDSGGWWTRTPDPIDEKLDKGRIQVLMHPEYWRGPQKFYFFLSAPRSGSTWLANFIDKATPLTGKHEFSLNHRYQDKALIPEKRTLDDMQSLLDEPEHTRALIMQAREWMEDNGHDYGETNVYLHYFTGIMNKIFPDAIMVLLHRHPADVVRSLLNRDWYDTPEDERHPPVPVANWNNLDQFEKVCWFVRQVNETLLQHYRNRICFEEMTSDRDSLIYTLESLGIPVYSRLAEPLFSEKLNPGKRDDFPPYADWHNREKHSFEKICGDICEKLGYSLDVNFNLSKDRQPFPGHLAQNREEKVTELLDMDLTCDFSTSFAGKLRNVLYRDLVSKIPDSKIKKKLTPKQDYVALDANKNGYLKRVTTRGCYSRLAADKGLCVQTIPHIHCNIIIGAGSWSQISRKEGWKSVIGTWYRGDIKVVLPDNQNVMLLCLLFDNEGNLHDKRHLVRLDSGNPVRKFSFSTRVNTDRFALALYKSSAEETMEFNLQKISLEEISTVSNKLN